MAENTHSLLASIVDKVKCKPRWSFRLEKESGDLRLVIRVVGYDSAKPDDLQPRTIDHFFPVPTATYNERTWRRWVFERCRGVENHELGEWFRVGSEWPFAPLHGPGEDPYTVHEYRPAEDALTTQDGSVRQPYTGA